MPEQHIDDQFPKECPDVSVKDLENEILQLKNQILEFKNDFQKYFNDLDTAGAKLKQSFSTFHTDVSTFRENYNFTNLSLDSMYVGRYINIGNILIDTAVKIKSLFDEFFKNDQHLELFKESYNLECKISADIRKEYSEIWAFSTLEKPG